MNPIKTQGVKPADKINGIVSLLNCDFASASTASYYEDDPKCANAANSFFTEELMRKAGKPIKIILISPKAEYCDHFIDIVNKYPAPVQVNSSVRNVTM